MCLVRVQLHRTNETVLGGLLEDSELQVKAVQTSLLKRPRVPNEPVTCANSRVLLSPAPSTGPTSRLLVCAPDHPTSPSVA